MRFLRPSRGRRLPGRVSFGAFLFATVVLAIWLGFQALDAAMHHRRTAEAVLVDYAEIAASEYSRTAAANLREVLEEVFEPVVRGLRGRSRPSPRLVGRDLDDAMRDQGCRCKSFRAPLALFRVDLSSGAFEVVPDTLDRRDLDRLVEFVSREDLPHGRSQMGMATVGPGTLFEGPVSIGYLVAAQDSTEADSSVFGFVVQTDALRQLFEHWYDGRRLLPEPLAPDHPNDSILTVMVEAPDGQLVFRSPIAYPTSLAASSEVGPEYGGLLVRAAIRPEAASQLIIGGLPNSRLPLLALLLFLTIGVGVAAVIQLRREQEFQRLRDDFVSGVSHELRTPLAQIRMFAELQEGGKLHSEEDQRRAITIVHRESRRLSHLVENILQFSKLRRSPGHGLPTERLDLAEVLSEGADAMIPLFEDRRMQLCLSMTPGLSITANRDALTRVVVNLLDNAVKYGPRGQVVKLTTERRNAAARISVSDEGPGIPPSDRRKIWTAYARLERDVKAQLPGTGIGLSVVAQLAALHRGMAWVAEAEGGGALFVVELPLDNEVTSDNEHTSDDEFTSMNVGPEAA